MKFVKSSFRREYLHFFMIFVLFLVFVTSYSAQKGITQKKEKTSGKVNKESKTRSRTKKEERNQRIALMSGFALLQVKSLTRDYIVPYFGIGYTVFNDPSSILGGDVNLDFYIINNSLMFGVDVGPGIYLFRDRLFSPSIGLSISYHRIIASQQENLAAFDIPLSLKVYLRLSDLVGLQVGIKYYLLSIRSGNFVRFDGALTVSF